MKIIYKMILKDLLAAFAVSLLFFILVFQIADVFSNLWRYLNSDVSFSSIGKAALLYIPKCISYSIPVALLFSIAFTLGAYYANNELITIFGSGISLLKLAFPYIIFSLMLSVFSFFFEDTIVIKSFKTKNEYTRRLLKQDEDFNNSNITLLAEGNKVVYFADNYNDQAKILSGLTIIVRNPAGYFDRRLDSEYAKWSGSAWELYNARLFKWNQAGTFLTEEKYTRYSAPELAELPENFRKSGRKIEELSAAEALQHISLLKKSGLPFREELTDYYKKFSFAFTPLIISLISSSIGSRFRKNILLMTLLTSLSISVVYYVFQMVTSLLAKYGFFMPVTGAWLPFFIFIIAGFIMFKTARN